MEFGSRSAKIFQAVLSAALVLTMFDPFLDHQLHSVKGAFPFIDIHQAFGRSYPDHSNELLSETPIHTIQGSSHVSKMVGEYVSTTGIVTGVRPEGFYIQGSNQDGDPATSEGIFVKTEILPPELTIGDQVLVSGTVTEYRSSSIGTDPNLSTTAIIALDVGISHDNAPLPSPVILGTGGRIPPGTTIKKDVDGDVETSDIFNPYGDGLDFYESLEGMRIQVNRAVVVGPTSADGVIPIIGDGGENASTRTGRGGIVAKAGDFNPERILIDDEMLNPSQLMPQARVGDSIPDPILGIMDYSSGNYKLQVDQAPVLKSGNLPKEIAPTVGRNQLAIATFNVDNLSFLSSQDKFSDLANQIVNILRSPDVLLLEEIQDDSGLNNNGEVKAGKTLTRLIIAIQQAGGPVYEYRQINPKDGEDGGQPGGNIRQVFLCHTDRGLEMVDRGLALANIENDVAVNRDGFAYLDYSPGRIGPSNPAFKDSRKPLAVEFLYHGQRLFVIGNHFVSRRGDQPLFGRFQPPDFFSQVKREQQADVVHDFVQKILTIEPQANVVVLGDLNDYPFSQPLTALKGNPQILHNLMDTLPVSERYSVVHEGNSEGLDHILVSSTLFRHSFVYDSVHVNAEYEDAVSDHDPQVLVVSLNQAPIAAGRIPDQSITIGETYSYTVPANIFSDPDPDTLGYTAALENGALLPAWLRFDRTTRMFRGTPGLNDPGTSTIRVTATDPNGASVSTKFRLIVLPKLVYSRIYLPFTRK